MKKKVLLYCSICIVLMLSLWLSGCSRSNPTTDDTPLVRTQVIAMGGSQTDRYPGEVKGRYETQLAFQVSGKILRRNIEVGSKVNAGDVLMEIDTRDIQQNVNLSQAQVAAAQSQLRLAKTNLDRYSTLFAEGAVSQAQLDQYQNAYEVAREAVKQAAAQNAQGSNQLGYSALVADGDGVITTINAEAGQVVSAGQPIITLVKDGEREVEINVPENRIAEIQQGHPLLVTFWALPGVSCQGSIREISPIADKLSRTYKVRVSLINPPAEVGLGMTASAGMPVVSSQAGVVVPLSAIYQTGNQPYVWLVKENVVTLCSIKTKGFTGSGVLVTEGLKDGDVIVTAGVQKLTEGQKVRL